VLIPRPATETIIEQVLLHARAEPGFGGKTGEGVHLVDACTGSGCIAISLLKQLPKAQAIATDISTDALTVASGNARRHKVDERLTLLDGDLLAPLIDHPPPDALGFHFIVANPPYIPDHEWDLPGLVWRNVREYEPHLALRAGPDGLQYIRPLIEQAAPRLRPGGQLLIETAASTAAEVEGLFRSLGRLEAVRIVKDHEGLDRIVIGTKHAPTAV
jgi:release factor glutamine methyltransferase